MVVRATALPDHAPDHPNDSWLDVGLFIDICLVVFVVWLSENPAVGSRRRVLNSRFVGVIALYLGVSLVAFRGEDVIGYTFSIRRRNGLILRA